MGLEKASFSDAHSLPDIDGRKGTTGPTPQCHGLEAERFAGRGFEPLDPRFMLPGRKRGYQIASTLRKRPPALILNEGFHILV